MTDLFDLTGRTALVTGSSRGIGRALVTGLAEAGATVVVHGRDASRAEAVARELGERTGRTAHAATFDVADATAVDAGFTEIEERLGGTVDILVNNAGIQRRAPIADFSDADWQDLLTTNLTGPFHCARRAARGMIARGSGKIIQIGSVQSQLARPSIAPYSATKGGIAMFTKGLAADLSGHGIQVNTLAPGYFATELTAALVEDEEFSAWVAGRTPAGRWGAVEDLVGPLVFLAADASRFVTGQTLFVDGGMTAVV
ncbi:SDR family NAD(P)-dependent oxidoreductase [Brachybacterium huguangmaarense]|uniref:SDR family NAD(P)-dependent oxidoreductase n=1 Tax=Brachybacterium huguangmaarense TaxID=1652028 RepID=A0ABY6G4D9_9MICO|nr:SDR family NAD(P)-dependent oxidoreductase [Brachybacterium huguangmaarense]UYG18082.1 SDR family NAD(P)-dependent oxidoreductase [Brachybacterium huguangmaarense]